MLLILELACICLLVPFVIGPFLVYRRNSQQAFWAFDILTQDEMLRATNGRFSSEISDLEAVGFFPVAFLHRVDQFDPHQHVRTLFSLFYNQNTLDRANITEIVSTAKAGNIIAATYVEFSTDFQNGVEVLTNNSDSPAAFATVPERHVFRVPGANDIRLLLRIHSHYVSKISGQKKPLPDHSDAVRELQASITNDFHRQTELGYFYLDSINGRYRPTVLGAIFMTWKLAWPVGAIRRWALRANGRRIVDRFSNRA